MASDETAAVAHVGDISTTYEATGCLRMTLVMVFVLFHVVACLSDASHPHFRGTDMPCTQPTFLLQRQGLRLRGGLESEVDEKIQAQVEALQGRLVRRIEGRSSFTDGMIEDVFDELCEFLAFENRSLPDSSVEAYKKLAAGYEKMSADWVCLRCGSHTPPTNDYCLGCGTDRDLTEKVRPAEHVEISLPEQSRSMSKAMKEAQAGLSEEWNSKYRSANVSVGAGEFSWKEQELLVLPNMTLALLGRRGNLCKGRWWWKEGSNGQVNGVHFQYIHPHRPPYRFCVPTPYLERGVGQDEFEAFFRGEHPTFELNPELDLVWCVLDVWGGPWLLEACSVKTVEAIAVGCALEANVSLRGCAIGGLGWGERAACGVDVGQEAQCALQGCVVGNGSCGAAAVQVTQQGRVSMAGCHVETVDWGVSVDDEGSAVLRGNKFVDCIWGTWYLGFGGEGSQWVLEGNQVLGPGWYDERRPARLVERDNVVNDTLLYHRDWQEESKRRFREGKRDGFLQRHLFRPLRLEKPPRR